MTYQVFFSRVTDWPLIDNTQDNTLTVAYIFKWKFIQPISTFPKSAQPSSFGW